MLCANRLACRGELPNTGEEDSSSVEEGGALLCRVCAFIMRFAGGDPVARHLPGMHRLKSP